MINIRKEDCFLIITDINANQNTMEKIERILGYYDNLTLIDWDIEVKTENYDDIESQRYSPEYPNLYNSFNYLITKDYEQSYFVELSILVSTKEIINSEDFALKHQGDEKE